MDTVGTYPNRTTEAAKTSEGSSVTSIPITTCSNPQCQPRECSGPAHSMPQTCTRSGTTTTGERCKLGLCLSKATDADTNRLL